MDEKKEPMEEVSSDTYSAADRPFDFVEEGMQTALVCEADPSLRTQIIDVLKQDGYQVTESASARDAHKYMRFHVYQLVVVNEDYETDNPNNNVVLQYLSRLPMSVRRNVFVAMVTSRFRTMDNMAAFNRSVNLIINIKNIDDAGQIIKRAVAENEEFYHVYKETLKQIGRT